jgi:hypothetical protein
MLKLKKKNKNKQKNNNKKKSQPPRIKRTLHFHRLNHHELNTRSTSINYASTRAFEWLVVRLFFFSSNVITHVTQKTRVALLYTRTNNFFIFMRFIIY